ncbi:MAG: putative dehydrogenase, partial [Planctomycetota bacterium]
MNSISRRHFIQASTATAAILGTAPAVLARRSRSDELRVAVIGVRGRGGSHIHGLQKLDGVQVTLLCDVDENALARAATGLAEKGVEVETETDLRRVMDRKDIDIIATATPNHWHSLLTIWACQTGKDVYVEKPVSHNVFEGRQMVRAARKYNRIVQTGTQARSSTSIAEAVAWVQAGNLGKIVCSRGLCYKPRQSIGKVRGPQGIPAGVDYDLWIGPAPLVPLMRRSLHYDWHWDFATGNGDLGNQGIHQMDIARWFLGEKKLAPRVQSLGGRFAYDDDADTPNTVVAVHDYASAPLVFEVRGLPKDAASQKKDWGGSMDTYMGARIGNIVHCEEGHVLVSNSYNNVRAFDKEGTMVKEWKGSADHFADFIDAVRSRKSSDLAADIEEGHISSALCHTSNASYLAGQTVSLDDGRTSMGEGFGGEAFGRLYEHLSANGVGLDSSQ